MNKWRCDEPGFRMMVKGDDPNGPSTCRRPYLHSLWFAVANVLSFLHRILKRLARERHPLRGVQALELIMLMQSCIPVTN